ncbi:TadE/TadG family type IV pilus assembly protein [Rhizobium sp. C4]|uniref:TadE/TadG family type IV pilus assembly protein n=1 Tax=Rhizobium sp. C4 TaxID=1349800 RepID=UPI001E28C095|nr:TadE/TadG family type IV pilus assembly protein [Rhizobium sp. C4]MCD2171849.1 pilus assembly protein [Rhizobium sp. C4]
MSAHISFRSRATMYLRVLQDDRKGISAIEFALILPLVLVLLAGTVDIGQALMVDRRMDQIVATVSDLTAQQSSWTASKLDAILAGSAAISEPFGKSNLTIIVAAVSMDALNKQTVDWSRAFQTTPWIAGNISPVAISSTVLQSGGQMIVARATYSVQTPFASFLRPLTGIQAYNFTRTTMSSPRNANSITLTTP